MKLPDLERIDAITTGPGLVQGKWGDGTTESAACIMGAALGLSSKKGCVEAGWPMWLVELFEALNDHLPASDFADQMVAAMTAIHHIGDSLDTDALWRAVRLNAVLPIAASAVGDGDEPWRVECREIVQWSIANDGEAAGAAWVARASGAARSAWAAWAVEAMGAVDAMEEAVDAAEAALAAGAARAAGAVRSAMAVGAVGAAAWQQIHDALMAELARQADSIGEVT
jgi:hypothetical protein